MKSILRFVKAAGMLFRSGRRKLAEPCVHGVSSGGSVKPTAGQTQDGIAILRFREAGEVDGCNPMRGMVVVCARPKYGKSALTAFADALEAAQKVDGEQKGAAVGVVGEMKGAIGGKMHAECCPLCGSGNNNASPETTAA